jgi:hypothetical protein
MDFDAKRIHNPSSLYADLSPLSQTEIDNEFKKQSGKDKKEVLHDKQKATSSHLAKRIQYHNRSNGQREKNENLVETRNVQNLRLKNHHSLVSMDLGPSKMDIRVSVDSSRDY